MLIVNYIIYQQPLAKPSCNSWYQLFYIINQNGYIYANRASALASSTAPLKKPWSRTLSFLACPYPFEKSTN